MFLKKTYIIAEVGINHNGNFDNAKKLILAAKKCGASAVKFQIYIPEEVVTNELKMATYQKKNLRSKKLKMIDMIKKYELSQLQHKKLFLFAKKNKIDFISSAFDLNSLEFLIRDLNLKIIKIPSGEITNYPYLKIIAKTKKKVILSTGMSNIKEIKQAVKVLTSEKLPRKNLYILHCNTAYPTPYKDVNLNVINQLKKDLKLPIGYSDHSLGVEVSVAAVSLGAIIIEKHFTLNKNWEGPDQKSSLDIKEFENLVKSIRNIEESLGSKIKKITKSEKKNLFYARKSIVAKKNILKGEKYSNENLTIKRPAGGLSPMIWKKLLNKKAKFNFNKNDKIR